MKKIFSLFAAVLFAGSMMAGETIYYTLTPVSTGGSSAPHNSYTQAVDTTLDGIKWNVMGNSNMVPWRIGGKAPDSSTPLTTTRSIYSKTPMAENITKIVIEHGAASSVTVNSLTVIVASDANFTSVISTLTPAFTANGSVTVNRPDGKDWSNAYYKFDYNVTITSTSNKFIEFKKADFYHQSSEKVLTADPVSIDFGNVFTGATVAAKKVKVNFANLTGAVTYSGLSDPFSATGTIAADGDEITISASSTATAGESNQTLTIQSAADSKSVEVTVHINVEDSIHPVSVDLDEHNLTVEAGTRQRLIGAIMPANCTDPTLLWETSNAEVATVTKGSVLGVAAGSATITCKSHDDATKKDECSVTVTAALPKFVIDGRTPLTGTATTEATDVEYTAVTDNTKTLTVTFSEGAKIQGSTGDLKFADQAILIGKKDKHIHNTTALPGKITKFEIYYNKGAATGATASLSFGTSILTAAKETPDATLTFEELDKVYDVTSSVPDGSTFFWYQVTNEKNTQVQFRIYYQATPTAIDETEAAGKATKELREGQVLIIKGNKTYNILGQEIK